MSKSKSKKKPDSAGETAKDAVELVVEIAVVAPVVWLLSNTVGWVLDL
jgi:hypothetical protein